jgi:hypothetical protein
MREAQLSSAQYDRSVRTLADLKLIERRQWWFGGRSILFVRPTATTLDFVTAAATWQAAYEFLEEENDYASASTIPGSAGLLNPNGLSKPAKPGSAKKQNSKYIKTTHNNLTEEKELSGAHPASPACAQQPTAQAKEVVSGKKKSGNVGSLKVAVANDGAGSTVTPVTVKSLRNAWHSAMQKYYGGAVASSPDIFEFPPQEWSSLAQILQALKCVHSPEGEEDLQAQAVDILVHAIRAWNSFVKTGGKIPKYPSVTCIREKLFSESIGAWHHAGRPSHGLNGL